jgi:hypothetical protein
MEGGSGLFHDLLDADLVEDLSALLSWLMRASMR